MKQSDLRKVIILFIFSFPIINSNAQQPGLIVTPKNGNGVTILNPNGDKYSSATTGGFTTNDIAQSEIPYKVVPPMLSETGNDQVQGPSGGFTDIVSAVDGSGFYAYFDGTNLVFRLRMGGTNNGSKAYSILIDTDMKFGNTGPYADPNYIPASNNSNGNPGFEYEILFSTKKDVTVYNIDGKTQGVVVATYSLNTHSQISVALSKFSGDPDYFYDWGAPASTIGNPAIIRFVASAQVDPHPAMKGKSSDIFGVNDKAIKSPPDAWKKIIDAQCGFALNALAGPGALCATCTNAPVITNVQTPGTNRIVSGTWVSLDPSKPNTATISLYRNGTLVGTTLATTGMGWNITVPIIYTNDDFFAMAKATNESECLKSTPVTAGNCVTPPAWPTSGCASDRGISGTIPLGAEILLYRITAGTPNPTDNVLTPISYTNNATNRTFNYSGGCSAGGADVSTGTYMLRVNLNGCLSAPLYFCITGAGYTILSTTTASNAISVTTPVYNHHTSVSGTGATAGQLLRLYVNGVYQSSVTATGSVFTIENANLAIGDEVRIYAQATTAGACLTVSNPATVTCFSQVPAINVNNQGFLLSTETSISGTAPDAGATLTLYRGTAPSGVIVNTTTVAANKTWSFTGLNLIAGETYYATQTIFCEGAASGAAVVLDPTPLCPTITGTYTDISTSVNGTLPMSFTGKIRLYIDSAVIDSVEVVNATTWSIPVNTVYTNRIYADGLMSATAEWPGLAENITCPYINAVLCTGPSVPVATPSFTSINPNWNVTYSISNTVDTLLYSLQDTNGVSYGKSLFGNNGSLNLTSDLFPTPGTYNLYIRCTKVQGGSSCFTQSAVQVDVRFIVLPLKFINVAARKISDLSTEISWKVANEENVKYYQVEKSTDCISYSVIGTVNANSSNDNYKDYSFTDNSLSDNKYACYRVKAIDENGSSLHSKVVKLATDSKITIQISPNPASTQTTLYISSEKTQAASIEMMDLSGKVVMTKQIKVQEGSNAINLENLNKFIKGQYIIKVSTSSEPYYLKLLIQ